MKRLNCTRGWLALLALISLVAFGVLVIVLGDKLTTVQITFITTVAVMLGGELKAAFAFFFDGTPPKPEQATATSPTTDKEPA